MSGPDPAIPRPAAAYADRLLADAARAADGARARLGGAVNDLFRSPEYRLNDREHAVMTRMLNDLVGAIEVRLRGFLASGPLADSPLIGELIDPSRAIALPRLARSRMMRDADLAALLLRRCDEHHLGQSLRAAWPAAAGAMDRLGRHGDSNIADLVRSLLLAESRRIDRFGEPIVPPSDIPLPILQRMAWWIAAMLRDYLIDSHALDEDRADHAIAAAVTAFTAGCDALPVIDRYSLHLAEALDRIGGLEDAVLVGLLREGQLGLWVSCLSVRGRIDPAHVWTMLADIDGSRLTLLFRAAAVERMQALGMIAALFAVRPGASAEKDLRLARAAAAFDALAADDARAALRPFLVGRGMTDSGDQHER